MKTTLELAGVLAGLLNNQTLSLPFTAESTAIVRNDVKALAATVVAVAPGDWSDAGAAKEEPVYITRNIVRRSVALDVVIQKKISGSKQPQFNTELSAMANFVEEIHQIIRGNKRINNDKAIFLRSKNEPLYALESLEQFSVFTSIITVVYAVLEKIS